MEPFTEKEERILLIDHSTGEISVFFYISMFITPSSFCGERCTISNKIISFLIENECKSKNLFSLLQEERQSVVHVSPSIYVYMPMYVCVNSVLSHIHCWRYRKVEKKLQSKKTNFSPVCILSFFYHTPSFLFVSPHAFVFFYITCFRVFFLSLSLDPSYFSMVQTTDADWQYV